ncbi:porin-like protein [Rhodopseudomonas faecalis]|uniref:Porin n=1 Tax=Rhodopseudomonas faecalis TaxID=99655 RepID=A0A318TFX7_9BRAD|nr:porin [Rhodopseudomonas faecalis]PYF03596.1 porin-like protein [Rhodopseudomonas faecalis]
MSIRHFIIGSAASLLTIGAAQAADLPLKAKAVEYVKVCSLYGAGFYYIPGTDTCIKLGGYTRAEVAFNASGMTGTPAWNKDAGQDNRKKNDYIFRSRQNVNIDTRTATEYGVVRTYFDAVFTWTSGGSSSTIAGGELGVYFAFIQFAGFTFGKAVSQFSAPWNGTPGNITSNLLGGDDVSTGINQISYTAQFGNGVSGTISLEDQSRYRQSQLFNINNAAGGYAGDAASYLGGLGSGVNNYAGVQVPDIVGRIRVEQAWGLFQVGAAAHQVRASYYVPTDESTGHPGDKWGYAVMAALQLKNLPTGAGDTLNIDAVYADGASRYVIGGTTDNYFSMFGGSGLAYQSVGFGAAADGIFANGFGIETTKAWGIRGAFNHNWNPNWATSIFGSYSSLEYSSTGKAMYNAALQNKLGNGVVGSPDFNIIQIGTRTAWTPVKNLTFTGEVMWTQLDQNYSGVTGAVNAGGTKPVGARYELKDQDTWSGVIRAQRNF